MFVKRIAEFVVYGEMIPGSLYVAINDSEEMKSTKESLGKFDCA